jgi:mannose-6-phosphate isomerase-like protein (cupin superfamily)
MKFKKISDTIELLKKDYSKKILFSPSDFQKKGHLLQVVTIPSRTKQRKHHHLKQTEVYYILEGVTSIYINDNEYKSQAGDSYIVSPNDTHYLWNKSNRPFKLIVFKINFPENDEDTVWVE